MQLLNVAVETATGCCATLIRILTVLVKHVKAAAATGTGTRTAGQAGTAATPTPTPTPTPAPAPTKATIATVSKAVLGLAGGCYAVGAALEAAQTGSGSTKQISSRVPLLLDTIAVLQEAVEAGLLPPVVRIATSQLRDACGSWGMQRTAGTKAYGALFLF
jgi:hypothetical protein